MALNRTPLSTINAHPESQSVKAIFTMKQGYCITGFSSSLDDEEINHGGHGVPRSFDTKITFSSVKLRGKNS
jgi:hypothetical protein